MNEFDMSHNGYYPDGYDIRFRNYADAYSGISAAIAAADTHTALYPSGAGLANTNDKYNGAVITDSNPFERTLTLGSDVSTETFGQTALDIRSDSTAKNAVGRNVKRET